MGTVVLFCDSAGVGLTGDRAPLACPGGEHGPGKLSPLNRHTDTTWAGKGSLLFLGITFFFFI